MQGKRLLRSIRLKNLLSYGSEGETLELEPLNVLIGPNASGKSNLIEAISVLAAAPRDIKTPIREGGGVSEWLWKGSEDASPVAIVEAVLSEPPIRHRVAFSERKYRFVLSEEALELSGERSEPIFVFSDGKATLYRITPDGSVIRHSVEDFSDEDSILSQRRDPFSLPELTLVGRQYSEIRFFRNWMVGRWGELRKPQSVDLPGDFLLEDVSNLGLVLNDLQSRPGTKSLILEKLRIFDESIVDVTTRVLGRSLQILFHEKGLSEPVSAMRLSDGTLHYLCLLAILLHPQPPPLICLEEPEIGLHPDIIPNIAELLVEASQRTQLIVTTHSETLVSALSEIPEAVVVCERDDRGTRLRRLDPANLKEWLERYRLGDLWAKGEIGGNRW